MNLMNCKAIKKKTVLQEVETIRSLINKMHKHQATFFSQVMRREKLEHLVTT